MHVRCIYEFFYIGQNPAFLFLTLHYSVQVKIILELNNINKRDGELPYPVLTCNPITEMRDVVWKVLKDKEKGPLCPRKYCTS